MATFPSLTPNSRSLDLGNYPQTVHVATSGINLRFLQGSKRINQILTLGYSQITETDLQLIYTHYETQEGTLVPFDLPAAVWEGYASVPISAVDYNWRYAGTISVDTGSPLRYNVTVQLASVVL
jgi:hypothetical protein